MGNCCGLDDPGHVVDNREPVRIQSLNDSEKLTIPKNKLPDIYVKDDMNNKLATEDDENMRKTVGSNLVNKKHNENKPTVVRGGTPGVTGNTNLKEPNIKKLEKPIIENNVKDQILINTAVNQLDKKQQNSNGNKEETGDYNYTKDKVLVESVTNLKNDNTKDLKSNVPTDKRVDQINAPIVLPIEENANADLKENIVLANNPNNIPNNNSNNNNKNTITSEDMTTYKDEINTSSISNYDDLMKTCIRREIIGGKECDVKFTTDNLDLRDAYNSRIDTYNSLKEIEQKVKRIKNLPPEKKITKILTFDFIEVEDNEKIRQDLIHNVINNIKENIITQEDLDEINNTTTEPLIQKVRHSVQPGGGEEDHDKYSVKQRQFVKNIVYVNNNISSDINNPYKRKISISKLKKDIPVLGNLNKNELKDLNNNICADQELIDMIKRNEIDLLPSFEQNKIKQKIKNTPIGTQDFKKLRDNTINENVSQLRKYAKNKRLTQILPENLVKNNIEELEDVIMATEYDQKELLHYKVKLSKINKFHNMIQEDDIVVVTVSDEDLKAFEKNEEENKQSKKKNKNFKRIATKDFSSYYENQEILKNENESDTNNKNNEENNTTHKKLEENIDYSNDAKKLIKNYINDHSEKPALIDLKQFGKENIITFFNINKENEDKDNLKIAFFNPDFENKETVYSNDKDKKNVLDKLFAKSINDVNTIRVSVRDDLNLSFTDLMKKQANPKIKTRYTVYNKYAKDKKESMILNAKDFLKNIGEIEQDDIEHERQIYFEDKKEQFNLDNEDDEEFEDGERLGEIFNTSITK